MPISNTIAEDEGRPLAWRQLQEGVMYLVAENVCGSTLLGRLDARIFENVGEQDTALNIDRQIERRRLLGKTQQAFDLIDWYATRLGDLCRRWVLARALRQLCAYAADLAHPCCNMFGNVDEAGLLAGRMSDRPADPPGGVGAEAVAALPIEF